MSGSGLMGRVRSVFRRPVDSWHLSDTAAFDFSEDLEDDETPRFSQLKVVVSGEADEIPVASRNGAAVSTLLADDDDSLLGSSSSLGSPGATPDPCDGCRRNRERDKRRRVMRKLGVAALLYFLFMVGELIGERRCVSRSVVSLVSITLQIAQIDNTNKGNASVSQK